MSDDQAAWFAIPRWQRIFEAVMRGHSKTELRDRFREDPTLQEALIAIYQTSTFDVVRAYLFSLETK